MINSAVWGLREVARVLPRWKFVCAVGFFCFAMLGAVTVGFTEIGLPGTLLYIGLALIPVLYLLGVARKHRRTTDPTWSGFNPIPLGIVVSITLIFGGALLAEHLEPGRDPDAVMPALVGMELAQANDILRDLELDTTTHDDTGADRRVWVASNWQVTSQNPAAGTLLAERTDVELGVVKTGETPHTEDAPSPAPPPPSQTTPALQTTAPTTPPIPETVQPPPHNACLMIDPGALRAARMSPKLEQPLSSPATPTSDAVYACGNDLGEVVIEITVHTNPQDARADAEYGTRPEILTGPYTPFAHAARTPLDSGAKVIATDTGVSRITWAHGPYSVVLEINSDPVIAGLTPRHPHATIDQLVDRIIDQTEREFTEAW
ncbi:PASTA domain-containing protein (plasmid) [Nocardia sp. NBC_01377]|uniref:PASTA domain-containing protein n=1 Tax=Nocardia sp. NBC_01377 TaxID=2903595 RepID=UPI002F90752C